MRSNLLIALLLLSGCCGTKSKEAQRYFLLGYFKGVNDCKDGLTNFWPPYIVPDDKRKLGKIGGN